MEEIQFPAFKLEVPTLNNWLNKRYLENIEGAIKNGQSREQQNYLKFGRIKTLPTQQ